MELDDKEVINNSKVPPNLSISNFNKKIGQGFYINLKDDLSIINTRTIASFPNYSKLFIKNENIKLESILCKQIGFVNFPIIKYITETISLYRMLCKWYLSNKSDDEKVICSYGRRISHAIAINKFKKKYPQVKTIMIFGDLSGKNATQINDATSFIQKYQEKVLNYSIKLSLKFDGCIFLTRQMNDILNNKKPYLVIEGMCADEALQESTNYEKGVNNPKIILYTGVISKQYGFDTLVEAMQLLENKNYILLLYGIGSKVNDIKNLNKKNIKYMGYIEPKELKKIQMEADILINPRQNDEEFTKYSFPSKTLEYLVTGNPVIGYKLAGIPEEYYEFINSPEDHSPGALASKIDELGLMSDLDRNIYRNKTYSFLKRKTTQHQTNKILDFIKEIK